MSKQIAFIIVTLLTIGVFSFTISRIVSYLRMTHDAYPISQLGLRFKILMQVAFGQTKILRRPVIGLMHALVYWGFLVITIGTVEMILDGILGTERILAPLGAFYDFVTASGDIFAVIIIVSCLIFLLRRHMLGVKRFEGIEMTKGSNIDATIALTMITLLMVSLIGASVGYVAQYPSSYEGSFPVSAALVPFISGMDLHLFTEVNWWAHVMLVYIFANVLPYSKHFHVFMSMPNVFLSRLEPLTKLSNMPSVTKEVKMMMDPNTAFANPPEGEAAPPSRFGIKDVEDVSWKNYIDSLTCTECGRCTSVCPANITGKKLSPRKLFIDLRKRMNEKGPGLIKDSNFSDNKALSGDYVSAEELWACTTCNACAMECPVNIDHPTLIVDMRRYLVLEESSAPTELNNMFANIENNGAPWPFGQSARMDWAQNIEMNK